MKPILFVDFDGTICHDRYWRTLPEDEHAAIQSLLFGRDTTKIVHDWMRGRYTAEEVNAYAAKEIGLEYDYLWNIFVDDCVTMFVSKDVLKTVYSLSDTYTTILITGNMDSFTRFTVPALSLEKYFDRIINSFYEGRHKTDNNGALFKKCADEYNIEISTCILLDDSSEVCDVFTAIGGMALRITSQTPIEQRLHELK